MARRRKVQFAWWTREAKALLPKRGPRSAPAGTRPNVLARRRNRPRRLPSPDLAMLMIILVMMMVCRRS